MNYKILLPLLLATMMAQSIGNWTEGNTIGVAVDSPASNVIMMINLPGTPPTENVPNEWHTIDVSGLVPPDTKAVFLNVKFAISRGAVLENCMIILHLKRTGFNPPNLLSTEVAKLSSANQERGNYDDWMTVENGRFDFMWEKFPTEAGLDYPTRCAVGLSMRLSAYLR